MKEWLKLRIMYNNINYNFLSFEKIGANAPLFGVKNELGS